VEDVRKTVVLICCCDYCQASGVETGSLVN